MIWLIALSQAQERCDLLAMAAPSGRSTPAEILDLLKTAKTSLLIWRPPPDESQTPTTGSFARSHEPWANKN